MEIAEPARPYGQEGKMSFFIKSAEKPLFIHSDIDSAGMSVALMDIIYADKFDNRKDAEAFMKRCIDRYPAQKLEIVEHDS